MPTRRSFARMAFARMALARIVFVGAALATTAAAARAQDPGTLAADFMREAGDRLAQLNADAAPAAEKNKRLHAFIEDVVDVEGIARFCIGRYWRVANPAQQDEYMGLFHEMLFLNVASRMVQYGPGNQAKITTLRPTQGDLGIVVPTLIERAGGAPLRVNWTVSLDSGRPRIVDVSAEGMSLRLTLRQDYTAFLARNNGDIEVLLRAMRDHTAAAPA